MQRPPRSTLFPSTTLFRSSGGRPLRWRGVALDNFNGRRWRNSPDAGSSYQNSDGNLFRFGTTEDLSRLTRSEEHTSELQSRQYFVCRLLLEKKHVPPPSHP